MTDVSRGAVIGCGYIAPIHLRAWANHHRARIVAVCDQHPERAQQLAREFKIPASYADARTMLAQEPLDFVEICTRPDSHEELIALAAARQIPVLCQKPLAESLEAIDRIRDIAARSGCRVMVHENWRFRPWYVRLRDELAHGIVGTITRLRLSVHDDRCLAPCGMDAQPYFKEMPDFILLEMGPHVIDTARSILGEVIAVQARLSRAGSQVGEDGAHLVLEHAGGAVSIIDLCWSTAAGQHDNVEWGFYDTAVEGTLGTVRTCAGGQLEFVAPGKQPQTIAVPWTCDPRMESYSAVQQHFLAALADGSPFLTGLDDTRRTMEAVFAGYESARQGRVVRLPYSAADHPPARGGMSSVRATRVVMLGSWPPIPGISSYCFELATAIGQVQPIEFIAFASLYPNFLYPGGKVPTDQTFPAADPSRVKVRRSLTWYNPFSWLREAFAAGDLLHAQFWSLPVAPLLATVLAGWRVRGKPTVLTLHNLEDHEGRWWHRMTLLFLSRLASAIIVHTEHIPTWLTAFCQKHHKRIASIPHGPLALYGGPREDRHQAREALGLPIDSSVVLFFGSIRPYKGLRTLLEAFAAASKNINDALLVIAGRPWEPWEPYRARIEQLGLAERVRLFLRYIPTDEVRPFFVASDVVALPYQDFHGQSGVAMSAIGLERPMLTSGVGGLAELADEPCYHLPPGDPDAWSIALERVLGDAAERARLTERSRQLRQRFSWDTIAQATLGLYQELLRDERDE